MDAHGYGVLDVTAERAQMDYFAVTDKRDPLSGVRHLRSYRTAAGSPGLERAAGPVA
jgi:alkaline phosphatase D